MIHEIYSIAYHAGKTFPTSAAIRARVIANVPESRKDDCYPEQVGTLQSNYDSLKDSFDRLVALLRETPEVAAAIDREREILAKCDSVYAETQTVS